MPPNNEPAAPSPKLKPFTKCKWSWEGWFQIRLRTERSKVGDVVVLDGFCPEAYEGNPDGDSMEGHFHRAWVKGYMVTTECMGIPFGDLTTSRKYGARRAGHVWRRMHPKFSDGRINRFKMNPIYSKPHPFFSK